MLAADLLPRRAVSQEGLRLRSIARNRHVPAHAARRIGRAFFALVVVTLAATPALAEKAGTAAQVIRAVDLRKQPADDAPSVGRLPKGTVVTLNGELKDGYVGVEVELEDGSVNGWVPREVLNRAAREALPEDPRKDREDEEEEPAKPQRRRSDEPEDDEPVVTRPRSRLKVPKDEGLLLRRESTFFYGVQAGGGISMLETEISPNTFQGVAFGAGAHLGYHISSNIAVRVEVNYLSANGSDPNAKLDPLMFGFLDGNLNLSYYIDTFEIYGGIGYAYGLSLNDGAAALKSVASASDLSTGTAQGGIGYRIPLSDVTTIVLRARYLYGFNRTPVGLQAIQGFVFLEFRG